MKKIRLNSGELALVDDEDYEKLKNTKWELNPRGYVRGYFEGKYQYLHRIVNKTPKGQVTEHRNNNPLDNRKANLMSCTQSRNVLLAADVIRRKNTSGVTGVNYRHDLNKWRAYITINGKQISLGCFDTIQEAIKARRAGYARFV